MPAPAAASVFNASSNHLPPLAAIQRPAAGGVARLFQRVTPAVRRLPLICRQDCDAASARVDTQAPLRWKKTRRAYAADARDARYDAQPNILRDRSARKSITFRDDLLSPY